MQIIIDLSVVEAKALETDVLCIQDFVENFVRERCRIAIDKIVDHEIKRTLAAGEIISGTYEDIVLASIVPAIADVDQSAQDERHH